MQVGLRRAAGATLFVLGLALVALYLFGNKPAGTLGFTSTFLDGSPTARVDTVVGDPAKSGGLAPGDLVRSKTDLFSDRSVLYLLANGPIVSRGDRVALRVQRGSVFHNVVLIAGPDRHAPPFEAVYFAALSLPILILGWFVLWVKPGSGDAITLGLLLLTLGLFAAMPDRVGSPAYVIALEIAGSAFYIFGVLLAAIFFAGYPDGEGTRHSRLRLYLMYFTIALTVVELVRMATLFLSVAFVGNLPWLEWPVPPVVLNVVVTLVLFGVAFHGADETKRMRLRWLGGSYFIGFTGPLFIPTATVTLGSRFSTIDQVLFESTLFILAVGLTYGVLRRRVIDLSFVLNRALVFTIVSGAVVAFFLGFEWLVGSLFIHISPRTSYAVDVAAAILIGVFLRPLHHRVDHFIDRVFFAKRHESENALRHLATEVQFIRERPALLERIERDLTEHVDAKTVSVYFREDAQSDFLLLRSTGGMPEVIDADDDAAVALAVEEAPVELHRRRTRIPGELAIPLAVRKTLVGILILGERRSGEAYAPDEMESLRFLSGYLGTALAVNFAASAQPGGNMHSSLDAILQELRSQRGELASLGREIALCREQITRLGLDPSAP